MGPAPPTVEDRLRGRMDLGISLFSILSFSFIFDFKFGFAEAMGWSDPGLEGLGAYLAGFDVWDALSRLGAFVQTETVFKLMFLAIFFWQFVYRRAVRNELGIMATLFSRLFPPDDWHRVAGRQYIGLLSLGLTASFITMALVVDRFPLLCLIFLALNLFDLHGNRLLRQNLWLFLSDEKYAPPGDAPETPFLIRRRRVAYDYWFERPQIERIILMAMAGMVAFVTHFSEPTIGIALPFWLSYLILAGTIVANEVIMKRWRTVRDRALSEIAQDEAAATA